jgi:AraC-like DNA-binding protein
MEEAERKTGIGRDVELYASPLAFNDKVLLDVYGAGLSDWNGSCWLERRCSPICGLEYVLEGTGRIVVSGESHDLAPGDVFLLHFHEHHAYGARDCAKWKKIWFVFAHEFITEAMLHLGLLTESRIRIPEGERPGIEADFRQILALLKEQSPGFRIQASTVAYGLLLHLSHIATSHVNTTPVPASLLRAVRYANDHLSEPLTVEQLSRSAYCSRIHLTRLFKRHFGLPTSEWIRSYRLGYARHLLATTDIPVKTIAAKVGYTDPLHFSSVFHKAMSQTPSDFRRQHLRDALRRSAAHPRLQAERE